jgi:hypothetical protein
MYAKIITVLLLTLISCQQPSVSIKVVEVKNESLTLNPPSPPKTPFGDSLDNWLEHLDKVNKPADSIIAFHFGILTTDSTYTLDLIGSKTFDSRAPYFALNEDYIPYMRYFKLPQKDYIKISPAEAKAKVVKLLKDYMQTNKYKKSFLSKAKGITVAHDIQDIKRIK